MLPPEELKWLRSTATELANLLQVVKEAEDYLETVIAETSDTYKQFAILRNGLLRASQLSRALSERVQRLEGGVAMPAQTTPASSEGEKESGGTSAPVIPTDPSAPKETVLVVDDEDFVTMLAKRVLTDEGYRVFTAKDGFQCLDLYKQKKEEIDLVILDFTMPILDGAEVFDELRSINPRVAVMLSSGFAEQDSLRSMLAKGLRGFIPKPYTQQKLLQQVRSTLDALKNERG
jgi:CheY-like chemotaxis protein